MSKKSILYIDDEPINLELFEMILSADFNVFTAESAFEAFDVLSVKKDISVVVTDWNMPGMNGIQFVKKAQKDYPDKNFLMLSGYSIDKEVQNAIDSGLIKSYIEKPINREVVKNEVLKYV
jgi:response regulator RpfG family c-di-GMP phosphodiesterase